MTDRALRLIAAGLALVGAAISAYLLIVRETGAELVCRTGGCETVQSSPYAELLGIPVAGLGLLGYATMLVLALVRRGGAREALVSVALAAVAFSGYLVYVQIAVIGSVCDWCLVSDAITAGIAVVALLRLRAAVRPTDESRESARRAVFPQRAR